MGDSEPEKDAVFHSWLRDGGYHMGKNVEGAQSGEQTLADSQERNENPSPATS